MNREGSPRAAEVLKLLRMNEGNSSGVGIGCVSWDGSVHADQFWRYHSFGNVRQRPFSEIWMDRNEPLMGKLKEKKKHVKGRCELPVADVCSEIFGAAEAVTVTLAPIRCYLTDGEIGLAETY
jgi:MoaA/NifB/PqqE/SkfB family radical SAM enzyme